MDNPAMGGYGARSLRIQVHNNVTAFIFINVMVYNNFVQNLNIVDR